MNSCRPDFLKMKLKKKITCNWFAFMNQEYYLTFWCNIDEKSTDIKALTTLCLMLFQTNVYIVIEWELSNVMLLTKRLHEANY